MIEDNREINAFAKFPQNENSIDLKIFLEDENFDRSTVDQVEQSTLPMKCKIFLYIQMNYYKSLS